jgi:D-3-phosphoglycerate dehydrogenase
MSQFKVVMTSRVLSRKDIEKYKTDLGIDFQSIPCNDENEIMEATRDADAVITLMQSYSKKVIENLQKCKLIFNAGTGFSSIDVQAATQSGICVAYPGEYCTQEVAEHAIALLFDCARKITRLDRAVKEGKWATFEKSEIRNKILPPIYRIKGQTLGLIGCGRIGRAILSRAQCLGLSVLVNDPNLAPEAVERMAATPCTFKHLIEISDFVIITASHPDTKPMFSLDQFKTMKPTSYLINISRGAFIDEKALFTALSNGYIAGAALDVVDAEPECMPPSHPLLTLENVIVTAHSAYYSEQSAVNYKLRIFEAISSIVHNMYPDALVNPEV